MYMNVIYYQCFLDRKDEGRFNPEVRQRMITVQILLTNEQGQGRTKIIKSRIER